MRNILRFIWRYWALSLLALVAIAGLIFQLVGFSTISHWIVGAGALVLTIPLLVEVWQVLRAGNYGVNVLGLTAVYSAVILHQPWLALALVFVLNGSQVLASIVERQTWQRPNSLAGEHAEQAHVLRGRKLINMPANRLQTGDKFIVGTGELVPADAIILEGSAAFEELFATSLDPSVKAKGEQIMAGSINRGAAVTARTLHAPADSQAQQLLKIMRSSHASQAPFVRTADRYTLFFTGAALLIAGAMWLVGHHAVRFLDVLVVATPFPLFFAGPTSLQAGLARANRLGIIFRSGAAFEQLAFAETFVFNKTGTLTSGTPEVEEIIALRPYSKAEITAYAASLEQASNHELAQAIVRYAEQKHHSYVKAKHVTEVAGLGVSANLRGKQVLVGQPKLLEQHAIAIAKAQLVKQTATYVAVEGQLAGIITFKDEPRAEAERSLESLRQAGLKHFVMITGDAEPAASAIAKRLGIDSVQANLAPSDKLHSLDKLERPVTFVGHGIYDAPLLTAADVGVALGAYGSPAAIAAADVVILPNDLGYVSSAYRIASRALSIARQTIALGILLSLVLMLVFATGRPPSWLGVALQAIIIGLVALSAVRKPKAK